jgi:hypothetical protein
MSTEAGTGTRVPVNKAGRDELVRRHGELVRRHDAELRLSGVIAAGGGIAGLVQAMAGLTPNHLWLIDPRHRVVARSASARDSEFRAPDLALLLEEHGPVDLTSLEPVLIGARPARGLARRHLLMPVARDACLFAWLVVAEVPGRLTNDDLALSRRTGFHLATEYAIQRRVASASWNARSALARVLVRGSGRDDDLTASADYLGVQADADRVIVYIADPSDATERRDDELVADRVAHELGVEVLGTRGSEGTILLVEAPEDAARVLFVHRVKQAMTRVMSAVGEPETIVGVSAVARASALRRAYRETREVVLCVDGFATPATRVIAVDDLGPARLFVANGDVSSVRRYVHDVLGALLGDVPGSTDLLRTLQAFFDTGRSVRESSARLGVHENTVRLRLGKIHDLTGLDVASDANDQLSAQTALLVLRLEGHPAIPPFDERHGYEQKDSA